jgi:23S rRNA pseudouridine1911/1915/1917 synthase
MSRKSAFGYNIDMEPKVIYQDEVFFVIDKPAGWITNEADTTTTQPVLQTWIRTNFDYPLKGDRELRDGIVHRLDKETSGLVIIAKTKEAFERLQAEFKSREVQKTYIALLHGRIDTDGKVEVSVGRLPWRRDRFGVIPGGRESVSEYKVLNFYPGNNAGHTLVEFYPKTGRTHQIRIHAKHIGHAIVADEFYAGRKTARNDRKWCPRLFLHASSIKFVHPDTNKIVEFKSDLPEDLKGVLVKITQSTNNPITK